MHSHNRFTDDITAPSVSSVDSALSERHLSSHSRVYYGFKLNLTVKREVTNTTYKATNDSHKNLYEFSSMDIDLGLSMKY